jgi:enolase-phosphatase E1
VRAQKLFFTHTTAEPDADLTPLVAGWFDTINAGPKTEYRSYETIMQSRPEIKPAQWLFLSDNVNEVLAARDAGMQSLPVVRPGNAPITDEGLLKDAIRDFSELDLVKAADDE